MADRTTTSTESRPGRTSGLVEPAVVGAVVGGLANFANPDLLFPGWGAIAGGLIGLGCGVALGGRSAPPAGADEPEVLAPADAAPSTSTAPEPASEATDPEATDAEATEPDATPTDDGEPAVAAVPVDTSKVDEPEVHEPKVDTSKVDEPKVDKRKVDKRKVDTARIDPAEVAAAKRDASPTAGAPATDKRKVDTARIDPADVAAAKAGAAEADVPPSGAKTTGTGRTDKRKIDTARIDPAEVAAARAGAGSTATTSGPRRIGAHELTVLRSGERGATGLAVGDAVSPAAREVRRVALAAGSGPSSGAWAGALVAGFLGAARPSGTSLRPFGGVLTAARRAWASGGADAGDLAAFVGLEILDHGEVVTWRAVAAGGASVLVLRAGEVRTTLPSTEGDDAPPLSSVRSGADVLRRSSGTVAAGDTLLACSPTVTDWVRAGAGRAARLAGADGAALGELLGAEAGEAGLLRVVISPAGSSR